MIDTKPAPGIYEGIPFADYLAIDAANDSTLKLFAHAPAEARHEMTHTKKQTKVFRIGDAVHVAVLEPKRFEREYCKPPKFNMRTNKGKAQAAEWAEKYGDYVSLLPDEWELVTGIRDAAWSHPLARQLLGGDGRNELTVVWNDEPTGLLCKGRVDRLTEFMGNAMVIDLKTCKGSDPKNGKAGEASVGEFPNVCARYRYYQKAAFYLDGLNALKPFDRWFIFMALEKKPPYLIAHLGLDDSDIAEGRARYRAALTAYAAAKESGEYPGYPVGIEWITMPRWAYEYTTPPR